MVKLFPSYTKVVRQMLKNYNEDLYNIFNEQNIEEKFSFVDNYNGGEYYNIVINVSVEFFNNLKQNGILEETENAIKGFYNDAMRGEDNSNQIDKIILKPIADNIFLFGENIDDAMWRNGYFRLFISHLTANKDSASNLKKCLALYGIDCFVAHKDIRPSKEWEVEIEKALFTMDALCAIVVPDFIKSQWCDQEVGIALGQRKLVLSIDKGNIPYGFFGKYQAIKSKGKYTKDVAHDVWYAIYTNEKAKTIYYKKIVGLILNGTNKSDVMQFVKVLHNCEGVNKQYIEILHDNWTSNSMLNSSDAIELVNPIFKKYGLPTLALALQKNEQIENDDLPF